LNIPYGELDEEELQTIKDNLNDIGVIKNCFLDMRERLGTFMETIQVDPIDPSEYEFGNTNKLNVPDQKLGSDFGKKTTPVKTEANQSGNKKSGEKTVPPKAPKIQATIEKSDFPSLDFCDTFPSEKLGKSAE